jgi:hypothetical protein
LTIAVVSAFASPVLSLFGFALEVFITHFIARLLGGTGQYEWLLYAMAAYAAPWTLIQGVLNISVISSNLLVPIWFYTLFLHVTSVKTVHQFSWAKAIVASFLLPSVFIAVVGVSVFKLLVG